MCAIGRTSGFENDEKARLDDPNTNDAGSRAASVNQNVEEIRERCWTKTNKEASKEVSVTRIQEVDDVEHEKSEERRKQDEEGRVCRNKDYAKTRSSITKRTGKNRTRDERLTFRSWCRCCIKETVREETVAMQLWKSDESPITMRRLM